MSSKQLSSITDKVREKMAATDGAPVLPPRVLSAPSQLLHYTEDFKVIMSERDKLQQEGDELRQELGSSAGKPLMLDIDLVDEGAFHPSPVDSTRLESLVSNLRVNPQSTPIVVRAKGNGRFETVAGRHRIAAFKLLGRTSIEATVKVLDDDETERLVFFDNLLSPNLSDFEKYQGFSRRKQSKGLSLDKLAEEAGISKSAVGRFLAFDNLPKHALAIIAEKPRAIGAALVEVLVALPASDSDRVIEALKLVVAGKLAQTSAVAWVMASSKPVRAANSPKKIFGKGENRLAELVRRGPTLVLKFQDEAEARAFERTLEALLKKAVLDQALAK